jgi:hypothetical protein
VVPRLLSGLFQAVNAPDRLAGGGTLRSVVGHAQMLSPFAPTWRNRLNTRVYGLAGHYEGACVAKLEGFELSTLTHYEDNSSAALLVSEIRFCETSNPLPLHQFLFAVAAHAPWWWEGWPEEQLSLISQPCLCSHASHPAMIAGNHRGGALVLVLVLTFFLLAVLAAFTIRGRARPALQRKSTTGHLEELPSSSYPSFVDLELGVGSRCFLPLWQRLPLCTDKISSVSCCRCSCRRASCCLPFSFCPSLPFSPFRPSSRSCPYRLA